MPKFTRILLKVSDLGRNGRCCGTGFSIGLECLDAGAHGPVVG